MQLNKKQLRRFCIFFFSLTAGLALSMSQLQAQENYTPVQIGILLTDLQAKLGWFGFAEVVFLGTTVFLSFLAADALRGGLFGRGMNLIAWGFLVIGIGHLHMQVEHFFHYNLFASLLGGSGGATAWFTALVISWGLSGLGFYSIYKASRVPVRR